MKTEPVVIIVGGIGAVISAALAVGVAFGLNLTPDQVAAVMGAVGAVASVVLALVARSKVTPVATLAPLDYGTATTTIIPDRLSVATSGGGPVTVKVNNGGGGSVTWSGPK